MTTLTGRWNKKISDVSCTGAVAANVFVGFDANTCGAGLPAAGISELARNSGERVDIAFEGLAYLKAGSGGWSKGDFLTSDAAGKGVVAGASDKINAQALADASENDVQEVIVLHGAPSVPTIPAGESLVVKHGTGTMNGTTNVDVTVAGATASSKYLVTHLVTPTGPITITPGTGKFTIVSADTGDTGDFVWAQIA